MTWQVWILFAYDDPDEAPVLDCFDAAQGDDEPTRRWCLREHGIDGCALYVTDVGPGPDGKDVGSLPRKVW